MDRILCVQYVDVCLLIEFSIILYYVFSVANNLVNVFVSYSNNVVAILVVVAVVVVDDIDDNIGKERRRKTRKKREFSEYDWPIE